MSAPATNVPLNRVPFEVSRHVTSWGLYQTSSGHRDLLEARIIQETDED